jgi:ubiquinone/menaquinone biosynthesis C-methylase UbiE
MAGADDAGRLLDVACGPGMVACAAAKRARQVTGIDLTPAMIEQARQLQAKLGLSNLAWRIGEAAALPFEDEAFDAVTTRYSAHHMPDPDVAFAELLRVARPGARVAIADMVLPPREAAAYDRMERLRDPRTCAHAVARSARRGRGSCGLARLRWADTPSRSIWSG